jgi:hypothetical protein
MFIKLASVLDKINVAEMHINKVGGVKSFGD